MLKPAEKTFKPWPGERARNFLSGAGLGGLVFLFSLFHPPFWDWQPQKAGAVGLSTLFLLLLLGGKASGRNWPARVGRVGLWAILGACLFTPPGELGQSPERIIAPRLLILLLTLLFQVTLTSLPVWLKRGAAVTLLLSSAFCCFTWLSSSPISNDFAPYLVAVDSQGRLFASDYEAPLIRVFSPEGSLVAKLRTDDKLINGTTGFLPPGPTDPEQMAQSNIYSALKEFKTCGLAADKQGHFYLVALGPRLLLRLDENSGRVLDRWKLPERYFFDMDCLAVGENYLYLAGQGQRETPEVLVLDPKNGEVVRKLALPGLTISIQASGKASVFVLAAGRRVCRFELEKEKDPAPECWTLPPPPNGSLEPYEGLALAGNTIFIGDSSASRVLAFSLSSPGDVRAVVGGPGVKPEPLKVPRGLAVDPAGNLIVSDMGYKIIQRFRFNGPARAWSLNGLWRALEDEEGE